MSEKSTLRKVVDTVKNSAVTAVHAAEKHVVVPLGKVVGLVKKENAKSGRKPLNRAQRKAIAQAIAGRRKMDKRAITLKKRMTHKK